MDIVFHCPLPAAVRPYQTARGARFVLFVCKATFLLTPTTATLSSSQDPVLDDDRRWDDKPDRSVFAPADLAPFKRDVDVVLVGHAYAPGGVPARSIMTRICVGEVDKSIEVFGDRLFTPHGELREGPRITRARLRYERAAGGPGTINPVGMRHDKKDLFGAIALPSLQPPGLHVTRPEDLVEPVGYGPIAPEWPARASRLGRWANSFAPSRWYEVALPEDLDPSFFNVAPPDQRLREVRPDERIVLEGLTADQPRFVTQLPALVPRAVVERITGRRDPVPLRADTLWIDTSRRLCTVTWRASIPLAHSMDTGRIVLTLGSPEASRVYATHDLATPMAMDDAVTSDTLTFNPLGMQRPVTPFEPPARSNLLQELPTDEALCEDDAITFVQSDDTFVQSNDVKTSSLPFIASQSSTTNHASNVPSPAFDRALPFAPVPAHQPSPVAPALPFVASAPSPAPQPPPPARPSSPQISRDLPFFSPLGFTGQSDSAVFPPPPPSVPISPAVFPAPGSSISSSSAVFPVADPASATNLAVLGTPSRVPNELGTAPPQAPATVHEAPPLIGPLATAEMFARSTPAATNEAPTALAEVKPAPSKVSEALPIDDFPIERCAKITASAARRKNDRAQILEGEKLEAGCFSRLQAHWHEAISAETDRGKTKLLERFDAAYVERLEEERGPIRPEEFARIVVAAERGHSDPALRELGLPPSALMRIERVFLGRTARDRDLAQRVHRAIEAERDV